MPFIPDKPITGRFVPDGQPAPVGGENDGGWFTNHPGVGMAEGAANLVSGAVAKPVSDIAGLAATAKEAISPTPGGGDPEGFQRSVREGLTYEPRTNAGRAVAKYNPLTMGAQVWGKVARAVRDLVAPPKTSGPARAALGYGVEEAIDQAPGLAGAKAPAASAALKGGARDMMQSALKPPLSELRNGKAAAAIDTLLDEGANVSRSGVEKMQGRVDVLNDSIKSAIESSPAVIDKQAVGYRLEPLMERFKKQVNPTNDLATIQRAWDDFLDNFPDKIPVKEAQELKQGTYRSLGDKAYGELKGADIEAQKALARGLKEEIAQAVPQVRALNAEESRLLNALSLTERRVLMSANKNPAGLGWLTTDPAKFAAWMADRSEGFKSVVARMLNTGAAMPAGAVQATAALIPPQTRGTPINQMSPEQRQQPIGAMQ